MSRYTIDLGEKFDELLTALAKGKDITKSEIIRRAVASYAYLAKETEEGRRVSITDAGDRIVKDVVLP